MRNGDRRLNVQASHKALCCVDSSTYRESTNYRRFPISPGPLDVEPKGFLLEAEVCSREEAQLG